jgi:hypothetical protein
LIIYVIADKIYDYPKFTIQYNDYIAKEEIEKLASQDNGEPWFQPAAKKYVLTKLYRSMQQSEMSNDLYLKESSVKINAGSGSYTGFYVFFISACVITLLLGGTLIYLYQKK